MEDLVQQLKDNAGLTDDQAKKFSTKPLNIGGTLPIR